MNPRLRARAARVVLAAALPLLLAVATLGAQAPAAAQRPIGLQDTLPFDAAVHTATLPNGLKYFIRQNAVPAHRVSLRLAVKAGSLYEAEDQQGLAHLIEHMAFNGSAHFKPGELVAYFESTGARLGPHVNAYTSFDETVFMFDIPSDKPEVVEKALTALSDFAGGLSLTQEEVDKERGVVIEEWRGGLGASSRVRDKQLPVLYNKSRYAERLPIGKPDTIRTAPVSRLKALYDTWYRPERMAVIVVGDVDAAKIEQSIKDDFGPVTDRAPAAPVPDRSVPLQKETLVSIVTDPELTRSSVTIERKRPREGEDKVADYRRDLVERFVEHMMDDRFEELSQKPDAKFLGAGVGGDTMSHDVASFSMGAAVQDGQLEDGISLLGTEAKRVREFGFGASEMERAKQWMAAFYEHAYTDRNKTESGSYAREYVSYFLNGEPSPGIEYEYRLVQQLLPGMTANDASALAKSLLSDDDRVILATSPQKAGIRIPTDAQLQAALTAGNAAPVSAWDDGGAAKTLMEKAPSPGGVTSRRTIDDLGVTVVRFANGVEAWLKPTDFKNDQVVFSLNASGGASLASPSDFVEATLSPDLVGLSGLGNLNSTDLQKALTGKIASAAPYVGLSSHGISGTAAPAQLESALQLLYQEIVAPRNDPEAFALMKKQLEARVANRGRAPGQVFGEKVSQINSSNHYTSQPLTPERVGALDRDKMAAFYHARFANAADFTFFMVGTFKIDEALPLLAEYVGSLPSTGVKTSAFKDVGLHFPEKSDREKVEIGREPRGQTVISFYADPPADPVEQENISAATTILDIVLRDILREDLGQTYTVQVGLSQALPQRGAGHVQIRFGAAPENLDAMTARVMQEVAKLQKDGPPDDLVNRAKETAKRGYETSLRQNGYWLARLQTINQLGLNPSDILTRQARIDAVTPKSVQAVFQKYFPADRSTIVTLVPAATP